MKKREIPPKPREQYIVTDLAVIPVLETVDGWFVRAYDVFRVEEYERFCTRNEAMYCKLISDLGRGKRLENYKGSKYYSYYIDRLSRENPELLI